MLRARAWRYIPRANAGGCHRRRRAYSRRRCGYHEQGRERSGYVTESYLPGLARQVPGLNFGLWTDYRHDPQLPPQVAQDEQ
jgi:hypothetical protein